MSEQKSQISYCPQTMEVEVQQEWEDNNTFKASEDTSREKYYCLSMFPYPSGQLHMGHVRNYTIGDVIARYQRMQGKNVLQPMGWDAFGLPAENAAIQNNVPPAEWTYRNIDYMRTQLKRLGFGYDWQRELATCDPDYYRWEQWMFTRLFEKGLVYKKTSPVNWCPHDKTVLANEQVINERCWRCDTVVERKEIPQWFMKITAYADELLADLENMTGWPEQVRTMQRNWIGRSVGVEVEFEVADQSSCLTVFTTRPDTLMGVTYVAVAAEHPLALQAAQNNIELADFIEECRHITTAEAELETMEKKGVPTGMTVFHPVTGASIPIWTANFVLMGYGTGAVMAVPAHDQRDHDFACQHQLPIRQVIYPADASQVNINKAAYTAPGMLQESGKFDGLTSAQACEAIAEFLESHQKGRRRVNYRLRDWGVSRQRYWGAPIPIINCVKCGPVSVPDEDLPVVLPESVGVDGSGSPLKSMPEFFQTSCPRCHGPAERETDTFDTFMESSWYFARYTCADNNEKMLDERAAYWLPVDYYIGGIEHAILHLLYARFYHLLMRDVGLVSSDKPFEHLLTQGMVLKDGAKMSKSKGNTVDPQALIDRYGADTVRLFVMFAAPPEQSLEWSDSGVEGAYRFIRRIWQFSQGHMGALTALNNSKPEIGGMQLDPEYMTYRREIHMTLQQANHDFEKLQFNTVVSAGMKILNTLEKIPCKGSDKTATEDMATKLIAEGLSILLRLLAPIAPHVTHVLWRELSYGPEIISSNWPVPDPEALIRDSIELVIQVNGKLRGKINLPANASREVIEAAALQDANVLKHIADAEIKKVVVVPGRLVNIVAR